MAPGRGGVRDDDADAGADADADASAVCDEVTEVKVFIRRLNRIIVVRVGKNGVCGRTVDSYPHHGVSIHIFCGFN